VAGADGGGDVHACGWGEGGGQPGQFWVDPSEPVYGSEME
jgi:hypothetical protein